MKNYINSLTLLLFKSWWVILFGIFCFMIFERTSYYRQLEFKNFRASFMEMEREKNLALAKQKTLLQKVHSASDPAWIELVLKEKLGLVPENQIKVYFPQNAVTTH